VNLAPNGPEDGGLMLLKGSMELYAELFAAFEDRKPERGWNTRDRHDHTDEQIQWLVDRGCTWEKICAEPGDLLLWDSVSAGESQAEGRRSSELRFLLLGMGSIIVILADDSACRALRSDPKVNQRPARCL
jgi:hypothetical protein